MFITVKLDVNKLTTEIINVNGSFEQSLDYLNTHINKYKDNTTIYLEDSNRITIYERGLLYGRSIRYVYEILGHTDHMEVIEDLEYIED